MNSDTVQRLRDIADVNEKSIPFLDDEDLALEAQRDADLMRDAAEELERAERRLVAQVERATEWEARARSAEQALQLYGAPA